MAFIFLSLRHRPIFHWFLFWPTFFGPIAIGQHFGEPQGEGLKAQLLANLNRYSGQGERAAEGPMESLGRTEHTISDSSTMPTAFSTEAPIDPFSNFFALFRPSPLPVPSPPLFAPFIPSPAVPPIFSPSPISRANFQKILQPAAADSSPSDRRFHPQKSKASPSEFLPRSFPINDREQQLKTKQDKWGDRTAAEVIGEWRRRMYKVLKSARRQKSREGKAKNNGEMGSESVGADQLQHNQREEAQQHQNHLQNSLVLFGPPPSMIDARKAHNLARLFGVENTRNETMGRGATTTPIRRKHLHSFELRTMENGKMAKIIKKTTKTKAQEKERNEEEEEEEKEEEEPTFSSSSSSSSTGPSSPPIFPVFSVPSLSNSVPSSLLPLQFPTLLPPILPSPPSPVQLSDWLVAKRPSPINPLAMSQSPESDFLKELENVPEDYVDEQEKTPNFLRLPCLRDRSSSFSSASLSAGRPFPRAPGGCQKTEMALAGRREQPTAAVVKTPQTGIFFEASPEETDGGTSRNIFWDENREMCNSARLRELIKRTIVPSNVERSKRQLQQQAEQQFGIFYNVICGTGFFSYIAHTDEFCLMAVHDMNCYVFSPVCSSSEFPSAKNEKRKNKRVFNANSSKRRRRRANRN